MQKELFDEIYFFINAVANPDNWEYKTEYGPYGSYNKAIWIDSENIQYSAELLLEKLNDLE